MHQRANSNLVFEVTVLCTTAIKNKLSVIEPFALDTYIISHKNEFVNTFSKFFKIYFNFLANSSIALRLTKFGSDLPVSHALTAECPKPDAAQKSACVRLAVWRIRFTNAPYVSLRLIFIDFLAFYQCY